MLSRKLYFFLSGVFIGVFGWFLLKDILIFEHEQQEFALSTHQLKADSIDLKYNEELADQLFEEVRIVCLVMTHPDNHKTKAIHVKNTWAKKCNKLIFISNAKDDILETVVLPLADGRNLLWNKTTMSFTFAYENHFNDGDWFMKADDDSYLIMENLRYMLHQYEPETAYYFGHRYDRAFNREGYMAGGGYVLSRKALQNLITELNNGCYQDGKDFTAEDLGMGVCLKGNTIFVDDRDEKYQKRFFPVGVKEHMIFHKPDNLETLRSLRKYWYYRTIYNNVSQGNLDCCSDKLIQMHYIDPRQMYQFEYFIKHVHPFGVADNFNEIMPKKLELSEILERSNAESERRIYMREQKNEILKNTSDYVSSFELSQLINVLNAD